MQSVQSSLRTVLLSILLIGLSAGVCNAQVTFRITQLPTSTPLDASIYLSGNFEGWTGGQETYRLEKDADSLFFITIPQMAGTIQFKFTRGSWASVEKGPNGEEISNRTYAFGGNGAVVNITIHNWADLSGITSTATENVSLMDDAFYIPQLNRTRKIWIYLPPDYENLQDSFPVLYMHDGQNLFDDSTSFAGEWEVDETLNEVYDEANFGLIVVGIENDGAHRIDEYSPWINPQYGGGEGEAYIDFITETLKPYIDSTYRTIPSPEFTGLMGSSMGGLISHYGGVAAPEVFGRIGVFSPSFSLFDSCYTYTLDEGVSPDSKFYLLAGGQEGNVAAWATQMESVILSAGGDVENLRLKINPQGMHNEGFWSDEFAEAVIWLFTNKNVGIKDSRNDENVIAIFPNPASDWISFHPQDGLLQYILLLSDIQGRTVLQKTIQGECDADVSRLARGVYIARVFSDKGVFIARLVMR